MLIVVVNIGSSSFKYQLLSMENEQQLARGYIERVGTQDAIITHWIGEEKVCDEVGPVASHREAVNLCVNFLVNSDNPVIDDVSEIDGVGFKTVQAGERNTSTLLTDDVIQAMEEYADLAPAHNPPYLMAIKMFRELLPGKPLVGVFEPGFHTQRPEYAMVYGVPYEWYTDYGVQRYGYHGASHRYVTSETIRLLGLDPQKHRIVSCHLGGSSSLCAFYNGQSIDTSMGFSPQSGLLQGARVGDLDPFVLPFIMRKKGISLEEALEECSRNGGLKGISGISGDMREIREGIMKGNPRARLAYEKFIYDIKMYLGGFIVLMGGLDAIAFCGGIGTNDGELRVDVLSSLGFLGFRLDEKRNEHGERIISAGDSTIKAVVIETNEELVVARQTVTVIQDNDFSA